MKMMNVLPLVITMSLLSGVAMDEQILKGVQRTILRPLSEKLSNFFAQLNHPNGPIHVLLPTKLLNKLYEKKEEILSNVNLAIYGFGQNSGNDYPFPYRRVVKENIQVNEQVQHVNCN